MESDSNNWHSMKIEKVLKNVNSTYDGLTDKEAEERLNKYGYNVLRQKKRRSILKLIWDELTDPMIIILVLASVLSFILGENIEGIVILVIIFTNALISIVQERKAESSIEALKSMAIPTARVFRQGEDSLVSSSELVVGDVVVLEAGSVVPADIRLLESANLKVQEASLTGESVPVEKDADILCDINTQISDRTNMVYSSALVIYGRATGVVVATGMNTQVGNIASMLNDEDDFDTPIKRKLAAVGKTLSIVGIIVCIIIFGIGLMYERPIIPLLMTAISLAISIIPEGLPATATIVMALGVKRMVKENALIRKLPAVETLGSSTVICSDKTGTLTQNKMTVTKIAVDEDIEKNKIVDVEDVVKEDLNKYKELIYAGDLCNDSSIDPDNKDVVLGDPTEGALIFLSEKFGINQEELEEKFERIYEQPFDSDRKRMSTVHEIDGKIITYTKGAVDNLLPLCTKILTKDGERDITKEDNDRIMNLSLKMAKSALRVLGFAKRRLEKLPEDDENVEFDMTFIGIVGMIDPPREEVVEAIKTCKEAGIRTIMITGDHLVTAKAIASELGIWENNDRAILGKELDKISDKELDEKVRNTSVFARVSPNHKLRIIQSLKRNSEVAAMTGDGVNDAPALKAADIGIAMGINGTNVAKDAADMVLLDDDFITIVYAVKEGRRVYRNIQKVIQFLLAGNIAEILIIFLATLFNFEPPILAVHVLFINLATDTLPALALGVDPASKSIMKEKPVKSGTLFEKSLINRVILHGIFIMIATMIAYFVGTNNGGHVVGQTMAFVVLAISQMLHAFNQRSNIDSAFSDGHEKNNSLALALIVSFGILLATLFVPVLRNAFSLTTLYLDEWIYVLSFSILPVVLVEITKFIKRKFKLEIV